MTWKQSAFVINNYSNPTPSTSNLSTWKPTETYPVTFAKIGSKNEEEVEMLRHDRELYQQRVDFWNNLKPHVPAKDFQLRDEL